MLLTVVLVVWFVLSIPATLVIGRYLGAATSGTGVPSPEPTVAGSRPLVHR